MISFLSLIISCFDEERMLSLYFMIIGGDAGPHTGEFFGSFFYSSCGGGVVSVSLRWGFYTT